MMTVFLNGNLSKDVYMTQPEGFISRMVVKYANFRDPFVD